MTASFDEVMAIRGHGMPAADEVTLTGADPVFSTRFRIGEACANVLAGVGVAVSDVWELKTGRRQPASIDVRHAAACLRSTHYLQTQQPDGSFQVLVQIAIIEDRDWDAADKIISSFEVVGTP